MLLAIYEFCTWIKLVHVIRKFLNLKYFVRNYSINKQNLLMARKSTYKKNFELKERRQVGLIFNNMLQNTCIKLNKLLVANIKFENLTFL